MCEVDQYETEAKAENGEAGTIIQSSLSTSIDEILIRYDSWFIFKMLQFASMVCVCKVCYCQH